MSGVSRGSCCAVLLFPNDLGFGAEKLGHIRAVRNGIACLKALLPGVLQLCGAPWGGWSFPQGCWCQGWGCDPPAQSPSLSLCCCGWELLSWFHEREIQPSKAAIPQIQAVLGAFDVNLVELFVLSVWRFCFQAGREVLSMPWSTLWKCTLLSQELRGLWNGCQCKQSLPDLEPREMCALLIFDCGFKGQALRKFCVCAPAVVCGSREVQVG